ncbi:hypothetical protein ANANG_G00075950 [Anguilla anguilla]|uniref:EGF-like domain-containing protein n=1 Tax=Anguilla anguilla TaxID=7936 RepID=A0A9D3S0A4_ANGAN|nr:hypothetical protein ANANG_G00075950 [Anguilla anguilla]
MYPPWGPLLVLLAAWAAGEAPSTPPTPPLSSNEVLKFQETERTEEQNLVTENGIGNLESKQNEGTTARWPVSPSPSSIAVSPGPVPVPTPLCPGDQVALGGGAGCGCPAGLTKEGERCVCPAGFEQQGAAECQDVDECAGEGRNACGLHANCTNTAGSFTCSCHRGYLKGPTGDCQDVDECALAAVTGLRACVCAGMWTSAQCRNSPGSFSCSCALGYVMGLDGHSCVDVDECSFEEQCRREFGNVCVNTPGSFICQCQPGFRAETPACVGPVCPDYRVCQDVDECKESPDVCAGQGVCENTLGSYKCVCELGYRGNGTHCEDENECASGRHGCDPNARCGNVVGSYFCQCYQGYSGDGYSCFDVDECALNNGDCQQGCGNQLGGYRCLCQPGYQLSLDRHNCTDVNECLSQNGTCEQNCTNTHGSFFCSCLPGYQLHIDGHSCVGQYCARILMSVSCSGGCSHGCTNTPGGHICHCPHPLLLDLDQTTCVNVTSCDLRNGGCAHACAVRSEGRVHCSCKAGWELGEDQRSCLDVDECADFTSGGCQQVCVNHPGTFNCTCREGYQPRSDAPAQCTPVCELPCANGGRCVGPGTCQCPSDYTGPQCLTPLCTPPCQSGGRCVDVNKCTCSGGWQGARCQIEPVRCQTGCKNGGVCVGLNRCRCASGFTGNLCETAVMTPCVPPCQHGATCSPHNKCTCPEGTAGLRCEKLTCPVVTTVVSMARAVRKGVRESYVDRCGPLGVHLCTKYRINQVRVYLLAYRVGYRVQPQQGSSPTRTGDSQAGRLEAEGFRGDGGNGRRGGGGGSREAAAGAAFGTGGGGRCPPRTEVDPRVREIRASQRDAALGRAAQIRSGGAQVRRHGGRGPRSYTHSCGLPHVRRSVAEFITRRDGGVASLPENIFISLGSQRALTLVLSLLAQGEGVSRTGVLTPAPACYTVAMALAAVGVAPVPYHLCEEQGWALRVDEVRRVLRASRGHCDPRVLYVVNPGNPTGHVQSKESIEEVIRLAAEERLILVVNEVDQDSVHGEGSEFVSYRKVLFEMGPQFSDAVELISLHSISRGLMGEGGLRSGYMEVLNVDPAVISTFKQTLLSVDICPPVPVGAPEYWYTVLQGVQRPLKEVQTQRDALIGNVRRAREVLDSLPGVSCQTGAGGITSSPGCTSPRQQWGRPG